MSGDSALPVSCSAFVACWGSTKAVKSRKMSSAARATQPVDTLRSQSEICLLMGYLRHTLAQDEIFGPVQVIIPFTDEAEAIAIANGTDFGLVASCWSENGARQMRMARALRAGQVFINNYGAGGGVELPFGGTGLSGHGREKGFEALYGFSVLKTVAALHH